jgi:hypothetical protein
MMMPSPLGNHAGAFAAPDVSTGRLVSAPEPRSTIHTSHMGTANTAPDRPSVSGAVRDGSQTRKAIQERLLHQVGGLRSIAGHEVQRLEQTRVLVLEERPEVLRGRDPLARKLHDLALGASPVPDAPAGAGA